MSPEDVLECLTPSHSLPFVPFRDASPDTSTYDVTLNNCLYAVSKAFVNGFLDFAKFDVEEYDFYSYPENGDLNWIIPNKFIAFYGPCLEAGVNEYGHSVYTPDHYVPYFRKNNVTTIIQLNKEIYDVQKFTDHGFEHYNLYFPDGSVPNNAIMQKFLYICENSKGVIAVHCKAGLGRTGTMIACYLIKYYHFQAAEAIAWLRICRPGSVYGLQQNWLERAQTDLCNQGSVSHASTAITGNSDNEDRIPHAVTTESTPDCATVPCTEPMVGALVLKEIQSEPLFDEAMDVDNSSSENEDQKTK